MSILREHAQILRHSAVPAGLCLLIGSFNDQILSQQLQSQMMSDTGPGLALAVLGLLSLMNGFLFPSLAILALFYGLTRARGGTEGFAEFLHRVVNQALVEILRSWGSALAWGLWLIIPGLVRMLQLVYVPLVVAFLSSYQKGEIDALSTSRRYANKRPFRLLGYLLLFSVLVPLLMTAFLDPYRNYVSQPFTAFLCTILDLLILTLSVQILYRLFDRLRQEFQDESVLSVERHSLTPSGSHL